MPIDAVSVGNHWVRITCPICSLPIRQNFYLHGEISIIIDTNKPVGSSVDHRKRYRRLRDWLYGASVSMIQPAKAREGAGSQTKFKYLNATWIGCCKVDITVLVNSRRCPGGQLLARWAATTLTAARMVLIPPRSRICREYATNKS